jgi:hypothetical protein
MITAYRGKDVRSYGSEGFSIPLGGCETTTLDAPFFTDDRSEGAQEADGRLSTF